MVGRRRDRIGGETLTVWNNESQPDRLAATQVILDEFTESRPAPYLASVRRAQPVLLEESIASLGEGVKNFQRWGFAQGQGPLMVRSAVSSQALAMSADWRQGPGQEKPGSAGDRGGGCRPD